MHKMGSVSTLGVAYTTHTVNYESTWPFVTLPNFPQRAGSARHMSGALMVTFAPAVSRENFEDWDKYVSSDANQWM